MKAKQQKYSVSTQCYQGSAFWSILAKSARNAQFIATCKHKAKYKTALDAIIVLECFIPPTAKIVP